MRDSKILLIEDNPSTAATIRGALAAADGGSFVLEWVRQLSEGVERIQTDKFDTVLLDLSLPDSQGIGTFEAIFDAAPDVPILILESDSDGVLGKQAVKRGARDYLPPGHLDGYTLSRALSNAIERKTGEDALYIEKERAVVTLNSIGDAVLCTDIAGNITYLNSVAEGLTGWRGNEAAGHPLEEVFQIIDGTTRETARDPLKMAVERNQTVWLNSNCVLIRRDGLESAIEDSAAPIHDRTGRIIGAVIVFHDVSVARAMAIKMAHAAHHDVVTNLPNRILLNDRITQSIAQARHHKRPMAVMFLDLDHFKNINDSLGHAIGDELLQSVGNRLVDAVRRSDTVSRLGGDEFVVLLSEVTESADAATSAKKLLVSLNTPHLLQGHDVQIDGSIGISVYPGDGNDAETLIKNADMAMYHAKQSGRNTFQFFRTEMNLRAVQRHSLEGSLRRALERKEFLLHYQPVVNLDTCKFSRAEALIRWRHPDRGLIPPSEFVPVAEDCGLIIEVGRWVLAEACGQARAWQKAGLPPLPVSVNVSAIEFLFGGFVENVRMVLAATGLDAKYLELELTERVLMENVKATACILRELQGMGVHLAVDDFGTGYSSLSYLRQFPIDVLKIDQSFVRQISADTNDSTIVSAIISLGKSLKHVVIAEGVETQEQRAYLRDNGCAEGQGYLFGRPVTAPAFANLLQAGISQTSTSSQRLSTASY